MTLEQMGYVLDGQAFVKHIGRYKITLFPSGRDFIRRIIKDNKVIDMRKSTLANLESDKAFLEVLKNRELAVEKNPTIIPAVKTEKIVNTEIKRKPIIKELKMERLVLDTEVHLRKEIKRKPEIKELKMEKLVLGTEVHLRK